jgi:cytochrome c551/c552
MSRSKLLSIDHFKKLLTAQTSSKAVSARFKECPNKEKGCMSVEEVAKVVGPEFKEEHSKNKGKFTKEKAGEIEGPRLTRDDMTRIMSGRFKECPNKEKGCMSAEEVAEVVGPEWVEQHEKYEGKIKKKKKAKLTIEEATALQNKMKKDPKSLSMDDLVGLASGHRISKKDAKKLGEKKLREFLVELLTKGKADSPFKEGETFHTTPVLKKGRLRLTHRFPLDQEIRVGPRTIQKVAARISPQLLRQTFPNLQQEAASNLTRAILGANNPQSVERALDLCSQQLGGFGVRTLQSDNAWDNYHGDTIALYVEKDSSTKEASAGHEATLLYDVGEREFYLTGVGDWIADFEYSKRGKIKSASWEID